MRTKAVISQSCALVLVLMALTAVLPAGILPTMLATHGDGSENSLEVDNHTVGADGVIYTFTFTLQDAWPQGGSLNVTFPEGFTGLDNLGVGDVDTFEEVVASGETPCFDWGAQVDLELGDDGLTLTLTPEWVDNCGQEADFLLVITSITNPVVSGTYTIDLTALDGDDEHPEGPIAVSVDLVPDAPFTLVYTGDADPAPVTAGQEITLTFEAHDEHGNVNTTAGDVALSLASGGNNNLLEGELLKGPDGTTGLYSFTVYLNKTGTYTINATLQDSGGIGRDTPPITVEAAGPDPEKSTIVRNPSTIDTGAKSLITVTLRDGFGNIVNDTADFVCIYISDGNGSLSSEQEGNDCGDGVKGNPQPDGKHTANLTATEPGTVTVNATINHQESMKIKSGVQVTIQEPDSEPATIELTVAQDEIVADGESTVALSAILKDADGAKIEDEKSVCFKTTAGTLSGDRGECDEGYVEGTFQDGTYTSTLTSNTTAQATTVTARYNETINTEAQVSFVPGEPAKLAFEQEPSTTITGGTFDVTVRILDEHDNHVANATTQVSLDIAEGPEGATLAGPTTSTAANGTATFTGLSLDTPGAYTLSATSENLTSAVSQSFQIGASLDLAQYNRDLQATLKVTRVDEGMQVTWDPSVYQDVIDSVSGILVWRINSPAERIAEQENESDSFQAATYLDTDGTDTSVYIVTLCGFNWQGCHDPEGAYVTSLSEVPGYSGLSEDEWLEAASGPDVRMSFPNWGILVLVGAFIVIVVAAAIFMFMRTREPGTRNPDETTS